jgi:hypothetical protein
MKRSKVANASIYFNIPEPRNQLLKNGIVYTCRHKKRINTGVTVARRGDFKKFVKLAIVDVRYIGRVEKSQELKPYLKESGFETTKEWGSKIKDGLPGHLYKVRLSLQLDSEPKSAYMH